MKRFKNICNRFLECVTCSILITMIVVGFWQIFSRYVLNAASSFSEELLRYLLIWVSLLGGSYAYGKKKHLSIMLIADKLPPSLWRKMQFVIEGLILLFAVIVMTIGGVRAVSITMNQTSASMDFSIGYVYMVLPFAGVFITIYSLFNILELISEKKRTQETEVKNKIRTIS